MGRLDAKRAPSRAMLLSICFRLNAPPKSKIPTTKTTSNGRATANSSSCEPRVSEKRAAIQLRNGDLRAVT